MNTFSASEAKNCFGEMLSKAQRAPLKINKNGKEIAVMMSIEDYQNIEIMKLQILQARADQAKNDITSGNLINGDSFFDELENEKL